jgi:hypothetical protein
MGSSQTKSVSVIDIIKKISTEIISKNVSDCGAKNNNKQEMSFSNIRTKGCVVDFSNLNQSIKVSQDFSCSQQNENKNSLKNEFADKLKNEVESKSAGLTLGLSKTEAQAMTNMVTDISNKVDITNISKCVAETLNNQKMTFSKIDVDCTDNPPDRKSLSFKNLQQEIVSSQVAKCIQENSAATEAINKLQTEIDNKAKAKSEGIGFSFGPLLMIGAVVVGGVVVTKVPMPFQFKLLIGVIILLIIAYFIYSVFYSGKKEKFTQEEEKKIKYLQNVGKLSYNAVNNQKKLALRMYR